MLFLLYGIHTFNELSAMLAQIVAYLPLVQLVQGLIPDDVENFKLWYC